jgi:phospholipid/cholesterol/gamma-HCH transport system substrate-binding protein
MARTSFLERNQRVIGTLGVLVIAVGTVLGLLLQGGFLTPSYEVTAYFTDAGGIREGDNVTVAGLPAGKVDDVRIEGGMVALQLAVNDDVALPTDSRAEVVVETLLGRRSVALLAGQAEGPLTDGSRIPVERTTTPVDITELNDISVQLLEASDADAFERFMAQITAVTEGKEAEVRTLIDGLENVTAAIDNRRWELGRLLESLRTLSTVFGERDQTIVRLIDELNVVLGNLAERQSELERLLESTATGSAETADLVRRNRNVLDSALAALHTDLEVLNRHQLDLAAGIGYLNQAVEGYSSVGYSQGTPNRWANIFVQSLGPAGVDALVGQCGAVDQLFDHYFGTDCSTAGRTSPAASGPGQVPTGAPAPPSPAGVPGIPGAAPPAPVDAGQAAEDLPCTVGDVVDSALAGTGVPAAGTERCSP